MDNKELAEINQEIAFADLKGSLERLLGNMQELKEWYEQNKVYLPEMWT